MQNLWTQVGGLLRAEMASDLRRPVVLSAAALQVLAVAMLCYLGNPNINPKVWNSLYWISLVFSTLQAVGKTFMQVNRGRWIYLNQLASPSAIIIAKVVYSWALMLALGLANLVVFALLMDFPVSHAVVYTGTLALAGAGLGTVFTMISAIASKTPQPGFLAPVLSLPVILPLVLVGMQGSLKALNPVLVSSVYTDMLLLGALNFLVLVLAGVLFAPLWKD